MERVAVYVLLVAALSFMVFMASVVTDMIRCHRSIIFNKADSMLMQSGEVMDPSERLVVPYDEVVAMLLDGLEYDVRIDDMYVSRLLYSPHGFDFASIPVCNYVKEYYFNAAGEVSFISFSALR